MYALEKTNSVSSPKKQKQKPSSDIVIWSVVHRYIAILLLIKKKLCLHQYLLPGEHGHYLTI